MSSKTLPPAAALSLASLLTVLIPASAEKASPNAPSEPSQSLQDFAAAHPGCQEWTDGCAICIRPADGKFGCSLPGIACQPAEFTCRSNFNATALPAPPAPYSAPNPGETN